MEKRTRSCFEWGLVFLVESALQTVIIETSSINTAKYTSNLLPIVVGPDLRMDAGVRQTR
jgi:hypothetical protein